MSTTLYSNQTVSATGGKQLHPVKVAYALEVPPYADLRRVRPQMRITAGTTPPHELVTVDVVLVASPFDIEASEAPATFLNTSTQLTAKLELTANESRIFAGKPFTVEGHFIYAWINAHALGEAITLSLELPDAP